LEFLVKSFEKNLLVTFSRQKAETLKMFYRRLLQLKKDIQNITDLEATHWYFFIGRYFNIPCVGFATGFCKI
jgi:hypothetical protein